MDRAYERDINQRYYWRKNLIEAIENKDMHFIRRKIKDIRFVVSTTQHVLRAATLQ